MSESAQVTALYTEAKDTLTRVAIDLTRGDIEDRWLAATKVPAHAVALTLDALWERPELAQPLADYFNVLAESRRNARKATP